MWLKLCFLLLYVLLLFVLARVLEALAWCEFGLLGLPSCSSQSCRLLDPVLLSVAQLKALLDQRGLNYDGVVEKSELTELVNTSGQVSVEGVEESQIEDLAEVETNFTSGAHFIEQVEDAKDSVWLVEVSGNPHQPSRASRLLGDSRWKTLKRKILKFGVRMGHLDCSLDARYCHMKGWHSNFVLLALPSQHQKKASVALYNFSGSPVRETTLLRWVRDKLNEKVERITDIRDFKLHWQNFGTRNRVEPEVRVVFFTRTATTPLFYSALSVKFPGRVKFGRVSLDTRSDQFSKWQNFLNQSQMTKPPAYVVYTAESNYTYGLRHGEPYTFMAMERFLKSLYPCLNDIFIISFCLSNVICWLEPFVSNCGYIKRFKKLGWCVFKYNLIVILLWLPIIGIFQMPYLDQFPLLALKGVRTLSMSNLGQTLRGDYYYYLNHPALLVFTFTPFVLILTVLCKRFRSEEVDGHDDWFNFSQMRTLTHLRPNDFFEPMRVGGYDLLGGFDIFGSRLSQPSLWLPSPISPDYIQHLPTWKFQPISLAERAQLNAKAVEATLAAEASNAPSCTCSVTSKGSNSNQSYPTDLRNSACLANISQPSTNQSQFCGEPVTPTNDFSRGLCVVSSEVELRVSSANLPTSSDSKYKLDGQLKCLHCGKTRAKASAPPASRTYPTSVSDRNWVSSSPVWESSQMAAATQSNNHPSSSIASPVLNTCSRPCSQSEMVNTPRTHSSGALDSSSPMNNPAINHEQSLDLPLTKASQRSSADPCPPGTCGGITSSNLAASKIPSGYLESYQCVICLEEYAPLTSLCGLPCGHVFHETCIISWLNRDKHFCPMCRWPSYRPRLSQCQPPASS